MSLFKQFSALSLLFLISLTMLWVFIARSDLPMLEKLIYLVLISGFQVGLIIFEVYLHEEFEEKNKDEGQAFWGLPKSYGGGLT